MASKNGPYSAQPSGKDFRIVDRAGNPVLEKQNGRWITELFSSGEFAQDIAGNLSEDDTDYLDNISGYGGSDMIYSDKLEALQDIQHWADSIKAVCVAFGVDGDTIVHINEYCDDIKQTAERLK